MQVPETLREAAIKKDNWTTQQKNIVKTLETLRDDLNVDGWDQLAKIYFLQGDEEDPEAHLAGVLPTHPLLDLQGGYANGMRVSEAVHGLVVASEGYRHLFFEEAMERNPGMLDRLKVTLGERGFDVKDLGDEKLKKAAEKVYDLDILPSLGPPADLPAPMRAEVRTVSAVLRDGTTINVGCTRDKDDQSKDDYTSITSSQGLVGLRIPTAMYLFLHDLYPDGETKDPVQAVSDYQTLKALEDD